MGKAARHLTRDTLSTHAGDAFLATALLSQARSEHLQWSELLENEAANSDTCLVCLVKSSMSILTKFLDRLEAWQAGAPLPTVTLMQALGPTTVTSDSDS